MGVLAVDKIGRYAYIGVRMRGPHVPRIETGRSRVVSRLPREGWEMARHGSGHDIFRHPRKGVVSVPRHRELSPGVARAIAKAAGWL